MINSASDLLYTATHNRMYFSSVIILVPSDWASCGNISAGIYLSISYVFIYLYFLNILRVIC